MAQYRGRVLVCDDQSEIREFVAAVLREEGYDVAVAVHGAAALVAVAEQPPDVIVLDMEMPVLGGSGFVREYRALPGPHAPIIAMTAAADAFQMAGEMGADDCLPKPFDVDVLIAAVARFCPPQAASTNAPGTSGAAAGSGGTLRPAAARDGIQPR